MRIFVKYFKLLMAYLGLLIAIVGFSLLGFYFGYMVLYGSPPQGTTGVELQWYEALWGIFLLLSCVRVWWMWRKG